MTSDKAPAEAYVWLWLPDQAEPVVAGRLEATAQGLQFNYGRSYLARNEAIALYDQELPLRAGQIALKPGLMMPGCVRDASPDAWGRRVIINRLLGIGGRNTDPDILGELTYLLESGSDRIGALDFQRSPSVYQPRTSNEATLDELLESAERVEQGVPLSPELAQAIQHGSSIGGARPKALIADNNRKLIAKFSSSADVYNVVKAEFIAMRLAALAGLKVAPVSLARAAGKDVLLIERFDRIRDGQGWKRRLMVSALTLLELDELHARYASYETLAEIVRMLVFNILCGNTDDHARNHAAFWDGHELELTPAYDLCPQSRTGNEATQAMLIHGENRFSSLRVCVDAAAQFQLSETEARAIINQQLECIRSNWQPVCDEASLTQIDRELMWGRMFLNPFALQGYDA